MIKYQKIIVTNPLKTDTIYTYLKTNDFSESYLKKLRKSTENILLNNQPSIIKCLVFNNDVLLLNQNPGTKTSIQPIDKPLDIVFEDDYILVVNKPSGLSSMANRSHYENNLAGQIVFHCTKTNPNFILRIVNRLDKDTQGIIIIAKALIVYKTLLETSKKIYHAVLKGNILNSIDINSPIKDEIKDGRINLKRVIAEDGKPAQTFIKPLKNFKNHTLCEIEIVHGRTHQIRVHTSSVGHGIEGDYIYTEPSDLIDHTALVCKKISFYHPIQKKELFFEVDYEQSFVDLLNNI
jgi:23S rRNA pseudouridine1911/1915/1917 synthase